MWSLHMHGKLSGILIDEMGEMPSSSVYLLDTLVQLSSF